MINRILAIAQKEFYQIWRDKRSLGLLAFVPTFTLLLFGFALSLDTKHIKLAIVDDDRSDEAQKFIRTFSHTEYFDVVMTLRSGDEARGVLDNGDVNAVMVIPADFGKRILASEGVSVQALIGGDNSNAATAAVSYIALFVQDYGSKIRVATMARMGVAAYTPVDYRPRIWFNPELKSSKYLVPGLMGYVLVISTVISTALSLVREKEKGTIEQMMVSPVSSGEFIIGKTLPYFVVGVILATAIIVAGWALFGIGVKGSIVMLVLSLFFFIVGGLGLGLMISSVANTQETAFFIATFATVLPTQLLSGFIFPIENLPLALQAVTTIVPAKYLLIVLRSILLKGAPVSAYWTSFVALAIFAVLTLTIAIRRLKKTV
ncbi:MAG: ABC transporter permease [Rhizobacter sp.]|nr:ABC transporter permease [Chlorobiales bacterium]